MPTSFLFFEVYLHKYGLGSVDESMNIACYTLGWQGH